MDARYKVTDFLYEGNHGKRKVLMVVREQPMPWLCPSSRKNNLGKIYRYNPNRAAQESMRDAFMEFVGKEIGGDGFVYPFLVKEFQSKHHSTS